MPQLNVKLTVDGAEEMIKLLDEASSLIKRLQTITRCLSVDTWPRIDVPDEDVTESDHE